MPDLLCEIAFSDAIGFYTQLSLKIINSSQEKNVTVRECGLADKNKRPLYSIRLAPEGGELLGHNLEPTSAKFLDIDTEMIKRTDIAFVFVKVNSDHVKYFTSKCFISLMDE